MADAAGALSARSKVQAFLEAACAGDLEALRKLGSALDEEGKGAAAVAAGVRDANRRTALHFAAREGRTEVCQFLVEQLRFPVDPKDDDGETPLIHAARQGRLETAEYLLDHGADPSVASNIGATALHHAAGKGHIELMKLLLGKGVDVESESDAGTPLVWAAGHEQQDAVKLLLEHNAKPNNETADGLLSAMGEYTIQISTKLIDQLAHDDEKVKRKVRRPRPNKAVEQQPEEPLQDNASRELPSEPNSSPAPGPGWSLPPPMYLPVTAAPPPPLSPAIQEVEAIQAVVEESTKVLEKLDKAEDERQQELARRAKELHDREFKLPYQNPVPCADEKAGFLECYVSNAVQDLLKCAEAVRRFEACVRMARQRGNVSGVATK